MGLIETLYKPISGIQKMVEKGKQYKELQRDLESAVLRRELGNDGNSRVINRGVQIMEAGEYPRVRLGDIAVTVLDHLLYLKVIRELSLEDLRAEFQPDNGKLSPVLEVLIGHLGLSLRTGTLPERYSFQRDITWSPVLGAQLENMKSEGLL